MATPQKILVVDDESDIRLLFSDVLRDHGWNVDTVADGKAAWMSVQSTPYDLIITDNVMPLMTGVELIKAIHDARLSLPIILATGTLPGRETIQAAWFQRVILLLKPVTIGRLLAAVTMALSERAVISIQGSGIVWQYG